MTTNAQENNTTVAMLQVFTVAQVAADKSGLEPVTVATRATKDEDGNKKVIPADQRTRSILIPELQVLDVPSKYQMLVLDTLRDVAKAQLSYYWQQDAMLREVPAAVWNVDSLLAFAAREAESKRLTKAGVSAWFDSSKLCAALMAKGNKKVLENWTAKIVGISAPTLDYNEEICTTIISTLKKFPEDADSFLGQQLIAKLEKRIANLQKQQQEIGLEDFEV